MWFLYARCAISAETSSNYKQHRRTPSTSSSLAFSTRDDDDSMVIKSIQTWDCACLHFTQKKNKQKYGRRHQMKFFVVKLLFDKSHSHLPKCCLINHPHCQFKTHYSFELQFLFTSDSSVSEIVCLCVSVCIATHRDFTWFRLSHLSTFSSLRVQHVPTLNFLPAWRGGRYSKHIYRLHVGP